MATAEKKQSNRSTEHESVISLFRTADRTDKIWLTVGIIGAIVSGLCLPYFALIFGRILNNANNEKFYHRIPKLCEQLVGLTVVSIVSGILQVLKVEGGSISWVISSIFYILRLRGWQYLERLRPSESEKRSVLLFHLISWHYLFWFHLNHYPVRERNFETRDWLVRCRWSWRAVYQSSWLLRDGNLIVS